MSAENPRFILGLKLKKLRQERGSTLKMLSDRAGISVSYLSEIEKGKKYPKPERLLALADALDVPFDELVSLKVAEELGPLKAALASPFMREFPFRTLWTRPRGSLRPRQQRPSPCRSVVPDVSRGWTDV